MKTKYTTIEFYENDAIIVTSNSLKHKSKLMKLQRQHPSEIALYELEDGLIQLVFPLSWFKLPSPPRPKRNLTEEQRQEIKERFQNNIKR